MGRRSRASLAAVEPEANANGTVITEPLIKALEHIPPVLPIVQPPMQAVEDDLTPPPALVEEPEAMEPVEEKPKRRRNTKVKKEPVVEIPNGVIDAEEPVEPVEEKAAAPKRKRASKAKQAEADSEIAGAAGESSEQAAITPKKKRASKVKAEAVTNGDDQINGDASNSATTPKRKRAPKASMKPAPTSDEDASSSLSEAGDEVKPKKEKKKTPKKSRLAKDEPEYDSEGNEIVKKKRKPKVYPKIEYDIPPVERKETTFKGE